MLLTLQLLTIPGIMWLVLQILMIRGINALDTDQHKAYFTWSPKT